MQTDSNTPSVEVSISSTSKVLRLLIPRSQRRKFFIQFTLMTVVGWVVGGIASIAIERTLLQALPPIILQQQPIWYWLIKLFSSIVFAVIFAADQALILRRYLSARLWLLATSAGWLIANSVSGGWINYISSIATSLNKTLSFEEMVFFGVLSTISYIGSGIWLGFLQWLVLRQNTAGAWWWSFLPSISYFCISVLVWLLPLVQNLIPEVNRTQALYLSGQGLTAVILGVIPAIGFCTLKSYSRRATTQR
ncbi:hypothetical protein [Fischerella sp. PCC 9605]|uniref:hypothetical protein n=1 Tax=Fischerella sp. PCC 9605 TaxID=1173024 RepID=UPI0004799C70|nr:hypothetical protein [Fischerella sp. PCC 9605]